MHRQNHLEELVKKLGEDDFLSDNDEAVTLMGNFIRESFSDGSYLADRNRCYKKLGEIGGETSSEILRNAIYSEPSYNGKFIALKGYVKANQERSIPLLHEMITYPDSNVRTETYNFLAEFKDTSAIPILEKELEDFSEFDDKLPSDILWLRAGIAKALYKLTGEEVYRVIENDARDLNMKFSEYHSQGMDAEYNELCREFDYKVKKCMQSLKQK
jgi:HEAT repeat protein